MTVRIANGYLLTPAPWLRPREPAASEPIRAVVIRAEVARPQLAVLAYSDEQRPSATHGAPPVSTKEAPALLPAGAATGSSPHAARAAQAYAAASEPLRPWAVGCCLRVQA